MHTETSTLIRAPLTDVYELAAAVEDWPRILPHYRYVRVFDRCRGRRLVEMAAFRDAIPVWWMAVQECHPDVPEITYEHVRGITRGMRVEWGFEVQPRGVLVSIRHDLDLSWPLVGRFAADRVIGPWFVDVIAGRTLRRVRALAEQRQEERRQRARETGTETRDPEQTWGRAV